MSAALAGAADAAGEPCGFRTLDAEQVPAEIEAALLSGTDEVVSTHPGAPRWDGYPDGSVAPDVALLRRGVGRRLLYQHTARANLGMPSYVSRLAGSGGQVRTTPEGLERMLIVDRRTAFVPLAPPGVEPFGSVVTTHRPVVEFLYRGFERLWSGALPYEADSARYDEVSADIKVSVLRLMAAGLKDDAIAHRLGIATRTCRRHISQIMDELNATSRFQAGVKLARLRLLPLVEEPPPQRAADTYPWW